MIDNFSDAELLYEQLDNMTPEELKKCKISFRGVSNYDGSPITGYIDDFEYDDESGELIIDLAFG